MKSASLTSRNTSEGGRLRGRWAGVAVGNNNIRSSLGADGILLATIDMPGRSMNVFSADLMNSLEQLLDQVASRPEIRAVVIASGNQAFLAGAALERVPGETERATRCCDPA